MQWGEFLALDAALCWKQRSVKRSRRSCRTSSCCLCGPPGVQNSLLVRTPQERIKAMSSQGPDYVALLPSIELYFLLSYMFWILAPLYLPFAVVFFMFGYVVYRNQVRRG